jgi:Tol biopolymer transport system component
MFAARPAVGAGSIVRTMVYHEFTSLTAPFSDNPVMSANGTRAAFAVAPGTGDPATPNRIFVVNTDGTGLREVDFYTTLCFCGSDLDISADGSRVLSTDAVQLRIANADGSGARPLVTLDSNEIWWSDLTSDGSKVFFVLGRDTSVRGTNPSVRMERGIWVVNSDGSGLRQVVGPSQVASVLGTSADKVFPFRTNGRQALEVSADGSRVVFSTAADGERIFGVNSDGSGLHQLIGPVDFVSHVGISADGTKVVYDVIAPPCCSTPNVAGVINFDGSGRRALAVPSRSLPNGFPGSRERLQLSADGSRLLLGSTGVLYDTATGAPLQLAAAGGSFSSDPAVLVYDGMAATTMNDRATRFLYLTNAGSTGVRQLATLDLNPSSLGDAPTVSSTIVDPGFLLSQGRSGATVQAQISASQPVVRVSGVVLRNGLADPNIAQPVLLDDGRNGDATAGDSLFRGNLSTDCCAEIGPRTVRIKAEVRASDGRRHATAVDIEPFEVRQ